MTIVLFFSGLSVNNTPKLRTIQQSLFEATKESVELRALIKYEEPFSGRAYVIGQYSGIPKLARAAFLLTKAITHFLADRRIHLIYAVNPLAGFLALAMRKLRGTPYIYETHEIVCGVNLPFHTGAWRIFWRNLEKIIIDNSSAFFATDQYRLRLLRRYYHIKNPRVEYTYNVPLRSERMRIKDYPLILKDSRKYTISYCGGLNPDRAIHEILHGFALYDNPMSHLYLVGNCPEQYQRQLDELAIELGVQNRISFTGKVPNETLLRFMHASDVTFALYQRDSLNNRFCSPNKVFDAIHAGTPFITTRSPLTTSLSEYGLGIILNEVTPIEICRSLDVMRTFRARIAPDALDAAQRRFSWESQRIKLARAAAEALQENRKQ